jgi:3',5'-cyclic AMP phosphodiesterase CpdA
MVTIAHISDLHCGERANPRLDAACAALNGLGADLIVATGDITHSGRNREYELARQFFAGLTAPVVACPGNHDAPVFNPVARLSAPFARFRALGLATGWDSACGVVSVRSVNTARAIQARRDWSQGVYHKDDFAALGASFSTSARFRVIACHHPPHAPSGAALSVSTRGVERALEALVGPHHFLCGHLHQAFVYEVNGARRLQVMTSPTLASERERGEAPGFRVIRFSDTCSTTVWRWTVEGYAPSPLG